MLLLPVLILFTNLCATETPTGFQLMEIMIHSQKCAPVNIQLSEHQNGLKFMYPGNPYFMDLTPIPNWEVIELTVEKTIGLQLGSEGEVSVMFGKPCLG